jgi:hypothetical protein
MQADGEFEELIDVLRTLGAEKKATVAAREKLKAEQSSESTSTLGEAHKLTEMLKGPNRAFHRQRLKARIKSLVERIDVHVAVMHRAKKGVKVWVKFNGGYTRVIVYSTADGAISAVGDSDGSPYSFKPALS